MNDFYSFLSVLAHSGLNMSNSEGVFLLIVMLLLMLGALLSRKTFKLPIDLWASSIIPYIMVAISILCLRFDLWVPDMIRKFCYTVVGYSGLVFCVNNGILIFSTAFIIDTLLIFGLIRLILFIKHKISGEKSQTKQAV
jgi:hypothetical protein